MATSTGQIGHKLRLDIGLLSDRDLADLLEVNSETLQTWRSEGKGPAFTRLGKKVFYRLVDVTAWIEANVVRPAFAGGGSTTTTPEAAAA